MGAILRILQGPAGPGIVAIFLLAMLIPFEPMLSAMIVGRSLADFTDPIALIGLVIVGVSRKWWQTLVIAAPITVLIVAFFRNPLEGFSLEWALISGISSLVFLLVVGGSVAAIWMRATR